jgi:hypothetical protein
MLAVKAERSDPALVAPRRQDSWLSFGAAALNQANTPNQAEIDVGHSR